MKICVNLTRFGAKLDADYLFNFELFFFLVFFSLLFSFLFLIVEFSLVLKRFIPARVF